MIHVLAVAPIWLSADRNGDHLVDGADLSAVLAAWHTPAGDLNGDGTTDGRDLAIIFTAFGAAWAVDHNGWIWATTRDEHASWVPSPFGPAYRRLTATKPSDAPNVQPRGEEVTSIDELISQETP